MSSAQEPGGKNTCLPLKEMGGNNLLLQRSQHLQCLNQIIKVLLLKSNPEWCPLQQPHSCPPRHTHSTREHQWVLRLPCWVTWQWQEGGEAWLLSSKNPLSPADLPSPDLPSTLHFYAAVMPTHSQAIASTPQEPQGTSQQGHEGEELSAAHEGLPGTPTFPWQKRGFREG